MRVSLMGRATFLSWDGWAPWFGNGGGGTRLTSTSIAISILRMFAWRLAGCVLLGARRILLALTPWRLKKPSRRPLPATPRRLLSFTLLGGCILICRFNIFLTWFRD